jgi:hypothetical protein
MATTSRGLEFLIGAALALAGCAGPTFAPDAAPEYLVLHDQTPFYHLGPAQASAPDAYLAANDRVRLVRKEFGYSFALLPGGETGYVANEDLTPAPAEVAPVEEPESSSRSTTSKKSAPLPRPDLEAMPDDAPPRG